MSHQSNAARIAESQRDLITNTDERVDEINKQTKAADK